MKERTTTKSKFKILTVTPHLTYHRNKTVPNTCSSRLFQFQMDIGSVMPMLRTQQANSPGGAVARTSDMNGTKEGHWCSENSYDIPGGKVDTKQESSVQNGQGWHTQATKQTSVMQQEFSGADIKPNQGKETTLLSIFLTFGSYTHRTEKSAHENHFMHILQCVEFSFV